MKTIITLTSCVILFIALLILMPFGSAKIETTFNKTVGTEVKLSRSDRDRIAFKKSKAYIENSVQTLANYKMQYDKANKEDKQIIAENIRIEFANFNANNIENYNLKIFLLEIQEGEY